jgi:hypothetical protein
VSLEERGAVTAKIIDAGLAKADNEPGSQTVSMPGGFAGTPKFASPEHFVVLLKVLLQELEFCCL